MGRDHTLYSLVEGHVKFTRVARKPLPPQKGHKWIKKPWRKFVEVTKIPRTPVVTLMHLEQPNSQQSST